MTDVLTVQQRSHNMASIRSKDTRPEMQVRSLIHRMGYRYGLHCRKLPGTPDIVLRRLRKVVLVNGCFWHMHSCRYGRVSPHTNREFWQSKRQGNVARDRRNIRALRKDGWKVLIVWECWTRKDDLQSRIRRFLES